MGEKMSLERLRDWHRRVNKEWSTATLREQMQLVVDFPHGLAATFLDAHLTQPAQAVDVGVRPICQNSVESAEFLTNTSKPVGEVAAAWRLRIGSSDVWSFCTEEWQADFYGKQSGLPYEKQPLYARALSGEKAGPVGDGDMPTELDALKLEYADVVEERDHLRRVLAERVKHDQENVEAVVSGMHVNADLGNKYIAACKRIRELEEQLCTDDGQCKACEGDMCTAKPGCVTCSYIPASPTPDKEGA